jgi:NADH-quinone oxidoreductase subunit L/multicomponent Na+:H+ antiporter subunit D
MVAVRYHCPRCETDTELTPDDHDEKPVVEAPLGGREERTAVPDGGDVEHDHHGGPPADGWTRAGWRGGETTWFMLGPILAIAAGAVALGLVPEGVGFLRIVFEIVSGLPGVTL